ncbi:MAG: ATP-binding protein [Thermomicrobiales bacterium]|nr:ATP-binding protein [Thermomicrobiales bacterium]
MVSTWEDDIFSASQADETPRNTSNWNLPRFTDLVDHHAGAIGRVVSSEKEPAGSHQFHFWAADDALTLDIGHIVVAFSEEAAVIGVVDEPRRFSDMRSFLDDYFDRRLEIALPEDGPTKRPEILVFTVNVLATKHLRDDVQSNRPAVNGPVYFATPEAINYALGVHSFSGSTIPALMHTNGNYVRDAEGNIELDVYGHEKFQKTPLYLDEDYLLGPEAGHANWTGQSGLATKTSHALFLTSSIFQTLAKEDKTVAALMFNVKGPDLLWLDKPAIPEPDTAAAYEAVNWKGLNDDQQSAYRALGLEPLPFTNVNIFAPFRPNMAPAPANGVVDLSGRIDKSALNTDRHQHGQADRVFPIAWSLRDAIDYPHKVFGFADLDDKFFGFIYELRERRVDSIEDLNKLFNQIYTELDSTGEDTWNGHHRATIRKAENRFKGLTRKLGGLLTEGVPNFGHLPQVDNRFTPNEIRVVDISAVNSVAKELIVTATINRIWDLAEGSDMGVDKLIIFVDELNKYAPAGGEGGLRDTLVDIAARGRHLNVVLMGAQQFRSKVDGEVLGNCGTSLYGRIGDEEIINAAYRSISETQKQELLGLPKGRLLIRHAHYRSPLFGTFPLPPTLPGIVGQRVFGAETTSTSRLGDMLYRVMKDLMGDGAPSKASVLQEIEGLKLADETTICDTITTRLKGNLTSRSRPWEYAKNVIATHKAAQGYA